MTSSQAAFCVSDCRSDYKWVRPAFSELACTSNACVCPAEHSQEAAASGSAVCCVSHLPTHRRLQARKHNAEAKEPPKEPLPGKVVKIYNNEFLIVDMDEYSKKVWVINGLFRLGGEHSVEPWGKIAFHVGATLSLCEVGANRG